METRDKKVETFVNTIQKMKADYMLQGFKINMIDADQAFDSCHVELSEQGITLHCCNTNSHVPFVERRIRCVKERISYVRLMLPKKIKQITAQLMS